MTTLGVPDFRNVLPPPNTVGQFFVQGTVFYVLSQDDPCRYPRLIVDVFHPDQPASGASSACEATHTSYTLVPETANGVSPIQSGVAPPQFWEGFSAAAQVYFNQQYPGCALKINSLYRWENGEEEITTGIVFSQNYGR
ncbi:MAG TPA: hypothetical protein VN081_04970 [Dongiaceae bacterium]|nr:hypothetical protein [Dongiaceae bacterium]